ncbi:MAG: prephenate dehydrogenase/arogenate dehydrogenase family protein [Lentisphaeria bacterium]|jgi:prephenate dehydrogenase
MPDQPSTVLIAGLGLLGGSLGLALRRLERPPRVLGLARREESLREALAAGAIAAGGTRPEEWLPQADLTVLCLPVLATREFALAHAAEWRKGAVVTDVGSTKQELVAALTAPLAARGVRFVGSHPMAGSEQSGLAAARANLYQHATVFVTPATETDPAAVATVCALWTALDAQVRELTPAAHDRLVAYTSHLLHLAAAATVNLVLRQPHALDGTAGGFRDFTRIAASSPEMWADIFQDNRQPVLAALEALIAELRQEQALLERGTAAELHDHLAAARQRRLAWAEAWHARHPRGG